MAHLSLPRCAASFGAAIPAKARRPAQPHVIWPSGKDAAETPVACMVCHEVHGANTFTNVINGEIYTMQLRHPLTSTNVFSYNTGTNFAANFNPAVSVCGQCHNARGAAVSGSSRPPDRKSVV